MTTRISAIICTHNRVAVLPQAIESLIAQDLPAETYEILVIDNASPDNTAQVVKEKFGHVSNLKYIYEPILGLSQARNTGWQSARGEYVCYIDDDAIAQPNWLSNIIRTFETVQPKPGVIAGKIIPMWSTPKPDWLPDRCVQYLGTLDISPTARFLQGKEWIVGANMAFVREMLAKLQGFCTNLGRKGSRLLAAEEEDLFYRIKQLGYLGYYQPEVLVHHQMAPGRLNPDWFYRSFFWQGVSNALCAQLHMRLPLWRKWRRGIYFLVRLLAPRFVYAKWIRSKDPKYFETRLEYWSILGYALCILGFIR